MTPMRRKRDETEEQYAIRTGRAGGRIGGKRRAESLSPEERREIAQKAARARWANHNPQEFE